MGGGPTAAAPLCAPFLSLLAAADASRPLPLSSDHKPHRPPPPRRPPPRAGSSLLLLLPPPLLLLLVLSCCRASTLRWLLRARVSPLLLLANAPPVIERCGAGRNPPKLVATQWAGRKQRRGVQGCQHGVPEADARHVGAPAPSLASFAPAPLPACSTPPRDPHQRQRQLPARGASSPSPPSSLVARSAWLAAPAPA